MWIKKSLWLSAGLLAVTVPVSADMGDGNMTFTGTVTSQTCNISVNDGTNRVVVPPLTPATATEITGTVVSGSGSATSETLTASPAAVFNIQVSDCEASQSIKLTASNHGTPTTDGYKVEASFLFFDENGDQFQDYSGIEDGFVLELGEYATDVSGQVLLQHQVRLAIALPLANLSQILSTETVIDEGTAVSLLSNISADILYQVEYL